MIADVFRFVIFINWPHALLRMANLSDLCHEGHLSNCFQPVHQRREDSNHFIKLQLTLDRLFITNSIVQLVYLFKLL